jgi:hypothetical protein
VTPWTGQLFERFEIWQSDKETNAVVLVVRFSIIALLL